jgi:hypothetical protein
MKMEKKALRFVFFSFASVYFRQQVLIFTKKIYQWHDQACPLHLNILQHFEALYLHQNCVSS